VPAQVALADILVETGDWRGAEGALSALSDPSALAETSDGFVVLARIQLARGNSRGALHAANQALHGRRVDLIEPDARDPRPSREANSIAARARQQRGRSSRPGH
jgi:hypothetical protein